jgi:hypothetical protein
MNMSRIQIWSYVALFSLVLTAACSADKEPESGGEPAKRDAAVLDGAADLDAATEETPAPELVVTPMSLTLEEGTPGGTFGVVLSEAPGRSVDVSISSGDAGAATVSPATLTFNDGNYNSQHEVTVTPVDDADAADESLSITVSAAGMADVVVAVTVTDDDTQEILVNPTDLTVTEGGTATFSVSLAAAPEDSVTVTIGTAGGVSISPTTLTFTAANYNVPQTVTVTGAQDDDVEDESLEISVFSEGLADATVSVTVTDDDTLNIAVEPGTVTVTEGDDGESFEVTLTQQPSDNVTITVTSSDPDAASVSAAELTFTPDNWDEAQTVTVTGEQDVDVADESVTVTLSAEGLTDIEVAVTVNDDDTLAIVVDPTDLDLTEGGEAGTLEVTLSHMPGDDVAVNVVSSDTGAVIVSPTTLTFTPDNYDTAQEVTVTGEEDDDTVNESVDVLLMATGMATQTVEVTVTDNDPQSIIATPMEVGVLEGGTNGFGVRLAYDPRAEVTVNVVSADPDAASVNLSSLVFNSSDYNMPQQIVVTGEQDLDVANEEVEVTLSSTGLEDVVVDVTVTDDDVLNIAWSSTPSPLVLDEDAAADGVLEVWLTQNPLGTVNVNVTSGDPGAATVNDDQLTFTVDNWMDHQTVLVAPVQDDDSRDEALEISLEDDDGNLDSHDIPVAVIDDEEQGILIDGSSAADPIELLELAAGGPDTFYVTLAADPLGEVQVVVTSPDPGAVTVNGSDQTMLNFDSDDWDGATDHPVTVVGVHDDDLADESVRITMVSTTPALSNGVTVNVTDDDEQAIIVSPTEMSIAEEETEELQVRLAFQPSGNVNVSVASEDENEVTVAAQVGGLPLVFTSDNWNVDQVVEVTGEEDADVENEYGVEVTLSFQVGTSDDVVVPVDVIDVDAVNIMVEPTTIDQDEGQTDTDSFDVWLTQQPSSPVTVTVTSQDPGAVGVEPATGVFPLVFDAGNWNVHRAIEVTPLDDDDAIDEVVVIDVEDAATGPDALAPRTVTVTVNDDEVQLHVVLPAVCTVPQVDPGPYDPECFVTEGAEPGTFTVRLNAQPLDDTEVSVTSQDPGAVLVNTEDNEGEASDQVTLTFTPGDYADAQTCWFWGQQDEDLQSEKNVPVTVSSAVADTVSFYATVREDDYQELWISLENDGTPDEGPYVIDIDENSGAVFYVRFRYQPSDDAVPVGISSQDYSVAVPGCGVSPFICEMLPDPGHPGDNMAVLTMEQSDYTQWRPVSVSGVEDMNLNDSGTQFWVFQGLGPNAEKVIDINVFDDDEQDIIVEWPAGTDISSLEGPKGTVTLYEDGDTVTDVCVKLAYEPYCNDVDSPHDSCDSGTETLTILPGTDDTLPVTMVRPPLAFTAANYNQCQYIQITAKSDDEVHDEIATLTLQSDWTGGPKPTATEEFDLNVIDDDEQAFIFNCNESDVSELWEDNDAGSGSAAGQICVALAFDPGDNGTPGVQRIDVISSDETRLLVEGDATNSYHFDYTSEDWSDEGWCHCVNIAALSDMDVQDESVNVQFYMEVTGEPDVVSVLRPVSIYDDDQQDILVDENPTPDPTYPTTIHVNEDSSSDVDLSLMFMPGPTDPVRVTITGYDGTVVTVDPTFVDFGSGDYTTPQKLTISGVYDNTGLDALNDKETTLTIATTGTAEDAETDEVTLTVRVENVDQQQFVFTTDPANFQTYVQEGGPTGQFFAHLMYPPCTDAFNGYCDGSDTIAVFEPDGRLDIVEPDSGDLTFDQGDYNIDQVVVVRGLDENGGPSEDGIHNFTDVFFVSGDDNSASDTHQVRVTDDEYVGPPSYIEGVITTGDYSASLYGATEFTKRQNIQWSGRRLGITGYAVSDDLTRLATINRELGDFQMSVALADPSGTLASPVEAAEFDGTAFGLFASDTGGINYARLNVSDASAEAGPLDISSQVGVPPHGATAVDFWPVFNPAHDTGSGPAPRYGLVYRRTGGGHENLYFLSVNPLNGLVDQTVGPIDVSLDEGAAHTHPNLLVVPDGYVVLYTAETIVRCCILDSSGYYVDNPVDMPGFPAGGAYLTSVYDGTDIIATYVTDSPRQIYVVRIDPSDCSVKGEHTMVRGTATYQSIPPFLAYNEDVDGTPVEYAIAYAVAEGGPTRTGVVRLDENLNVKDDWTGPAGQRPSIVWAGDRWALRYEGSAKVEVGSLQTHCDNGLFDEGLEDDIDCNDDGDPCKPCHMEFGFTDSDSDSSSDDGDDLDDGDLAEFFRDVSYYYGAEGENAYILFEILAPPVTVAAPAAEAPTTPEPGAWCAANAAWYAQTYLANAEDGGSDTSGDWDKWFRFDSPSASYPGEWSYDCTQNGYANYYGTECEEGFSWCSEESIGDGYGYYGFGLQHIIRPAALVEESHAIDYWTPDKKVTIQVGVNRDLTCGDLPDPGQGYACDD